MEVLDSFCFDSLLSLLWTTKAQHSIAHNCQFNSVIPSHAQVLLCLCLLCFCLFQPLSCPGSHVNCHLNSSLFEYLKLNIYLNILKKHLKLNKFKMKAVVFLQIYFLSRFSSSINEQFLKSETLEIFLMPALLHCSH